MSLTVRVTDPVFPKLVQNALSEMCGCQSVAVDPMTGQVSIGPMTCSCYCNHRAGCNLLTDLVNDARTIPIFRSATGSGYEFGEVWWLPVDKDFGDHDVCGGTNIPASILLAHELVHARFNLGASGEDKAVRGENQIRKERCMPMRMDYVGETVPDFRVGVLDDSNRPVYGCSCPFWRGGLWQTISRWYCILHSMYCFPTSISPFWIIKSMRRLRMSHSFFHASESTPIDIRIAQARRVRTRFPMASEVDHSEPLLPGADWEVSLEHVGLHGLYRALLISVKGSHVKMLTNFVLQPGGNPYLAPPGTVLVLSELLAQSLADQIRARLASLQFADGAGGPPDAADGAVHFLKIKHGDRKRTTDLYFHHYPATANKWTRPDGIDGPRWDAVNAIYEIWRDIVTNPPASTVP